MDQTQFDLICKIIQNGAPALANELCGALQNLVAGYNEAIAALNEANHCGHECKCEHNHEHEHECACEHEAASEQ